MFLKLWKIITIVTILGLNNYKTYCSCYQLQMMSLIMENKLLSAHYYSGASFDVLQCVKLCHSQLVCNSFNFKKSEMVHMFMCVSVCLSVCVRVCEYVYVCVCLLYLLAVAIHPCWNRRFHCHQSFLQER